MKKLIYRVRVHTNYWSCLFPWIGIKAMFPNIIHPYEWKL